MPQLSSIPRPFPAASGTAATGRAGHGLQRVALFWWSGWVGTASTLGRDGIR